jgi:hypothetical protein
MQSRENKKEKIIRTDENKIDKTATMTCGHAKALEEFGDRGNSQIKLGTMPRSCYLIVQGIDEDQKEHCGCKFRVKSELSGDEIRGNTIKMREEFE